jgi:N-acyl-D-amino-acid deacylase
MLDLVIADGLPLDPERDAVSPGYVGVQDGRIAAVGGGPVPAARAVVDAAGAMVCPGFIDVHGHLDGDIRTGLLSLRQGVTTTVGGNCGYSPANIGAFLAEQAARGYPIHQAEMIGHSPTLRRAIGIGDAFAPASAAQIAQLAALAARALEAGACGVSFGLGYAPGTSLEEAAALWQVAAAHGRVAAVDTHVRTKRDLYSLVEILQLARASGARTLVSHFVYQYGEGVELEALALMRRGRQEGLDLWLDSGMYTHWATVIGAALFEREAMRDNQMAFADLCVATGPHIGQVPDEALYAHLRAEHPWDTVIVRVDNERAVYDVLREPFAMPSSDAGPYAPGEGHPQIAGTFPRFFARMVTDLGELTWLEAVTRATLLPAKTLGLADRGRLRIGAAADLVVFDPATLRDRAEYCGAGKPDAPPDGVLHVVVGGRRAMDHGRVLCADAGKPLAFS